MKKIIRLFYLLALIFPGSLAFSQKYKTAGDTTKLNKEYVKLTNDVVELNAKLTIAQNDLPGLEARAKDANSDAVNAASASSDQAAKATNGSIGDAKRAKRKAKKSYNEAKDSRSAKGKVSDQQNKITRYQLDIRKKQKRIEELSVMRAAIDEKIQAASLLNLQ